MTPLRPLTDSWTVRSASGDVRAPATVPGCVHTDLLAAGLIPDPYLDDNETRLAWVGRTEWRYETEFSWDGTEHERTDLVCEGLDTVAEIELNGVRVGETANMHRSYWFDVRPALRVGSNRLAVTFRSAGEYAERLKEELGDRPSAYTEPYNFIRKMACNFGWDWGPTLVTAGIWRSIGLHEWSGARLAAVRPVVTVTDGVARVAVHVEIERAVQAVQEELQITATVCGRSAMGALPSDTAVLEVEIPQPELWWPRGYGEQPLHELTVTLGDGLDSWQRKIGFRTVELDTADDAFAIMVNGRPIFAKGVNWIPDDCFPARIDRARYAERLAQACEAGVNLMRVWGGGLYESDDFYDLCDELGLLVWQDFPFACAAYSEEEPLRSEVEAEARENVTRLMPHPSLALWCGNNENIWGFFDWHWRERLAGRTWGEGYYLDLLPGIVAELDPGRAYWPGSPYSGSMDVHPNDPGHHNIHIWDVWNERDYTAYREYRPRFVSEFGFQGPATYATIKRAIGDEPLAPDSPGMRLHQKAIDGDLKLAAGLKPHFAPPAGFADWHYLTQVNQARAIQLGVEHFRSLWPHCAGTIVWQLNDCWPVTSWSAIDGDGRRKPLFHALRRAYADRLLTVQPRDGGLALVAVNDTDEPWVGGAVAARLGVDGTELRTESFDLEVPPRGLVTVPLGVGEPADPARELIAVRAGERRALWFFLPDKDLDLPEGRCTVTVEGRDVIVSAHTLVRDLAIFPDQVHPEAEVDDQLITLLPGESHRFTINREIGADVPMRWVNDRSSTLLPNPPGRST
ncbi:glycoside hydrolase family 2 protein [Nonomuraea sp. NPDC050022]|uniref:glycoside hydrolase family 2 protein n=1 Tax=Nonomuraea sp. NPDC050022 TaxID=3364358 RepID=UPI0037B5D447